MYKGIKFVKKANMWCCYHIIKAKDQNKTIQQIFWLSTEQEAQDKLVTL